MADSPTPPLDRLRKYLRQHLKSKKTLIFSREELAELLSVVFHTSLRHEEGRFLSCMISVVDASNPGGKDPARVLPQRASYVPFEKAIAFNTRNLVKLAHALPPWASSLAVCRSDSGWLMIGLFDQELHYRNSLNQEDGDRFDRVGFFQIEVTDIGAFSVYAGSLLIGRYSQGSVTRHFYDVLKKGPIADALRKYFVTIQVKAEEIIAENDGVTDEPFEGAAEAIWIRTLSRILLHIRRANHGGAVLLLPKLKRTGLKVKYGLDYSKLDGVIAQHIAAEWIEWDAGEMMHLETKDFDSETMPTFMHLRESFSMSDKQDAVKAEVGGVSTIASLARVDGLVLMVNGFNVRGFGVEITVKDDPPIVYSAGDSLGSLKKRKQLNLDDFGTRHRSMMRYCYSNPGSIGFVVSQDGDVRAIMHVKGDLLMWENIRLQDVRMTPRRAIVDRTKASPPPTST